jgi:hypothetical protein
MRGDDLNIARIDVSATFSELLGGSSRSIPLGEAKSVRDFGPGPVATRLLVAAGSTASRCVRRAMGGPSPIDAGGEKDDPDRSGC